MTALNAAVRWRAKHVLLQRNPRRDVCDRLRAGMVRRRDSADLSCNSFAFGTPIASRAGSATSPPEPRATPEEIELLADAARRPANRTPSPISAAGSCYPIRTALPPIRLQVGPYRLDFDAEDETSTSIAWVTEAYDMIKAGEIHPVQDTLPDPARAAKALNIIATSTARLRVKLPSATALARSRRRHSDVHPVRRWAPDAAELNTARIGDVQNVLTAGRGHPFPSIGCVRRRAGTAACGRHLLPVLSGQITVILPGRPKKNLQDG